MTELGEFFSAVEVQTDIKRILDAFHESIGIWKDIACDKQQELLQVN